MEEFSGQIEENADEIKKYLEELQKYIEELTRFLPLAFCTVNPFNLILGVSQAFCNLTGYNELEAMGNNIDILFFEKERIKEFEAEIINKEKKLELELTLVTKSQKTIPANVSALARREPTGEFVGYFLTITDISKTKQFQAELEKEVEKKTKELKDKIKELEKINRVVIGRELKMIELKDKLKKAEKLTPENQKT
ncbi:MAG: PAS domain-containing protein [bacterium]